MSGSFGYCLAAGILIVASPATAQSQPAPAPADEARPFSDIAGALGLPGHIILETRLRNEYVDQDGLEDANALTFAARFGYEVEPVSRLSFLVEGEWIEQLTDNFTDTVRIVPGRPVIADPEDIQLNRFQVRYAFDEKSAVTLGRQRIVYDDARFIGNVIFRQNEQTYDAVSLDWAATDNVRVRYAYLDRVNRIFGGESPVGEFQSDSHISQVDLKAGDLGALSLFVNALDFTNSPINSQLTYGFRWNRTFKANDWRIRVDLDGARQQDYRANTADFEVYYGKAKASVGRGAVDVAVAGEWLQGDGSFAFQTPLATLHAFQGFADVFLRTPEEGLRDLNLGLTWKVANPPLGKSLSLLTRGHIFTDDAGTDLFGHEFDALARLGLNDWITFEFRSAWFDGRDPRFPDKTRIWLAVETKF
ncbi:MAG: hypothetical protein HC927_13020 [Deltaproteobacteria bacterium]|nr:hypothetical protein [Deltaproteobacteria bacterium]